MICVVCCELFLVSRGLFNVSCLLIVAYCLLCLVCVVCVVCVVCYVCFGVVVGWRLCVAFCVLSCVLCVVCGV